MPEAEPDGTPLSAAARSARTADGTGKHWWTDTWRRARRIALEIAGEATITLLMIGLLWLVEEALDITRLGSRVLFQDAVAGANFHYGLRLGALFDLLHLGVLLNFVYRSIRHANHVFREDSR